MDFFSSIQQFNDFLQNTYGGSDVASVIFKIALCLIFSGMIGLERGKMRQFAGLRTHILVCIGSCIVMMTNLYICTELGFSSDPARLGAQVVTGVGFLGAGTIFLTGRQVVGLTTAAGLWASACMGLAIGIGFFWAAFIAAITIFFVLAFLPALENWVFSRRKNLYLHIEIDDAKKYMSFLEYAKEKHTLYRATISKSNPLVEGGISFRVLIDVPKGSSADAVIDYLKMFPGIYLIEDI